MKILEGGFALWTMIVVGSLIGPVEFHNYDACETAAKFIANDLQVRIYCINPVEGEIAPFLPTMIDEPIVVPEIEIVPKLRGGFCVNESAKCG